MALEEKHEAVPAPSAAEISVWIIAKVTEMLGASAEGLDTSGSFFDYGLDSVQVVALAAELEGWLQRSIPEAILWDHPTIDSLSKLLASGQPLE